jgi:hypothetical protein
VCAGVLERDGPRRGVSEPSSEADLARGVRLSPRSRRTPPEGALGPRARRNSFKGASDPRARRNSSKGASDPRARRTLLEGCPAMPPWQAAGATWVVVVSCTCFFR